MRMPTTKQSVNSWHNWTVESIEGKKWMNTPLNWKQLISAFWTNSIKSCQSNNSFFSWISLKKKETRTWAFRTESWLKAGRLMIWEEDHCLRVISELWLCRTTYFELGGINLCKWGLTSAFLINRLLWAISLESMEWREESGKWWRRSHHIQPISTLPLPSLNNFLDRIFQNYFGQNFEPNQFGYWAGPPTPRPGSCLGVSGDFSLSGGR